MKNTTRSIASWSNEDRPREKLLDQGAKKLSDSELLAIILGSGRRGQSAVELARELLKKGNGDLSGLFEIRPNELKSIKGIGPAKMAGILSVVELGHRFRYVERPKKHIVRSSQEAYERLFSNLEGLLHEEFWVLFLNHGNRVLAVECFSRGSLSATVVDVRMILKKALELSSTSLILAHNHPSGNLNPSKSDKDLTRKIIESGQIMDIRILDHLILSSEGYFSFADEGLL